LSQCTATGRQRWPVNMTVSATPSDASARWPGASVTVFIGPGLGMSKGLGDPIGRPLEFPAVASDTPGYPLSVQAVGDTLVKRRS